MLNRFTRAEILLGKETMDRLEMQGCGVCGRRGLIRCGSLQGAGRKHNRGG